jgi:hypothetical protein
MYLCYIDESGTSEIPGNTSHFVLAGLSLPISFWRSTDREISLVLGRYGLENEELHTAWVLRKYLEQSKIPSFERLSWSDRRSAVQQYRTRELLRLQNIGGQPYRQAKKNYQQTKAYIHLTHAERLAAVRDVADVVGAWGYPRLFAECIDKTHFDPARSKLSVSEQAFDQVVSRFQQYLSHIFVDSSLTRMVQMADLCAFSLRRYCESGQTDLFRRIFARADRFGGRAVGVRHFAGSSCDCEICRAHRNVAT